MSLAGRDVIKNIESEKDNVIDTESFLKTVKNWGATLAGIGDVREGLAREFRHIPVAISLAVAHPPVKEGIIRKGKLIAYTNQFPAVDAALEKIQKNTAAYLRSLGWKAFIIPPDTDKVDTSFAARLFPLFPHKTGATCAGLGWVGKNGLLITKEYGARLSWGTVLTDAPLNFCERPFRKGECKKCSRCVKICPAGAVSPEEWVRERVVRPKINVEACAGQLRQNYRFIGSYVCGLCIMVCPLCRI